MFVINGNHVMLIIYIKANWCGFIPNGCSFIYMGVVSGCGLCP